MRPVTAATLLTGGMTRSPRLALSAVIGFVVWFAVAAAEAAGLNDRPGIIGCLLLLGILVMVPLALGITPRGTVLGVMIRRQSVRLQQVASLLVVVALLLPQGGTAALLAMPWVVFAGLVLLAALLDLLMAHTPFLDRLLITAAAAYLAAGSVFLVVSCGGWRPLGFAAVIVELTAVHFHFAGFLTITLIARGGDHRGGRVIQLLGLGVAIGAAFIAAGFAVWLPFLAVGASILVACLLVYAIIALVQVAPGMGTQPARWLLRVSSSVIFVSMLLALDYAFSLVSHVPALGITAMAWVHGTINCIGFIGCGILAWWFMPFASRGAASRLERTNPSAPRTVVPRVINR